MFVVEIGAFLTLGFVIQAALGQSQSQVPITYFIALDIWLFLTVLFATFATALAEAQASRAQADSPRKKRDATLRLFDCAERTSIKEVPVQRIEAR